MSLAKCFSSLNSNETPLFNKEEMAEIRSQVLRLAKGKMGDQAEVAAVQSLLDQARSEQKRLSDLIAEEMGISPDDDVAEVPVEKGVAPAQTTEGKPTSKIDELQFAYDEAKARLDAIGDEPPKRKSEDKAFGSAGRDKAAPLDVARYDEEVKAHNSWRAKYSKLKRAEVEASNNLFRAKNQEAQPAEPQGNDTDGVKFSRTPDGTELKSLLDVEKSWESKGIATSLYEKNGIITVSKIIVPKEARNKGIGTAAMQELMEYADKTNQQIALTPSNDFGGSKTRLNTFYRNLGFRTYKGFAVRETLIRDAAKPATKLEFSRAGNAQSPFDGREIAKTQLKKNQKTIVVDGVEHPAQNGNGKPIHWSEEGTRNFWRQFSGSTVVDNKGRPIPVYHGTSENGLKDDAFDKLMLGSVTKSRSAKAGFFFVSDRETAAGYSGLANAKPVADLIAKSEAAERAGKWDLANDLIVQAEKLEQTSNPKEHVVEAYLTIKKPYIYDADEQRFLDVEDEIHAAIREAKGGDYDGIILKNLIDNADWGSSKAADHYIAFKPTAIKSATGNNGDFNTGTSNINFSRGSIPLQTETEAPKIQTVQNPDRKYKIGDLPRDMREELFNEHATNLNPEATERGFYAKSVPSGLIFIRDLKVDKIPADQLERVKSAKLSDLPPIVIADGRLIDGQHRIQAAREKGYSQLRYIDVTGLIDTNAGGYISEIQEGYSANPETRFPRGDNSTTTIPKSTDQSAANSLNRGMVAYFKDDSWERAYVQNDLLHTLSGIGEAVKAGFGKSLIGITPTTEAAATLRGINYGGKLYVNLNETPSFANITGHELWHSIEKDRPDLHQWFAEQAKQYYRNFDEYTAKLDKLLKEGETPHTREAAESELLADFTGDAMADPIFLSQLAKDDPGKFKQLLNAVLKWLKAVGEKLKSLGSDKYITDVEALRKHLNRVLIAYANGDRIAKMEGPVLSREGQTGTENFKRWFGNSVVTENGKAGGKPLVVYHSTSAEDDFSKFRRRVGDIGMHFGTVGQAEDRWQYMNKIGGDYKNPRIMPVYLAIKNPLRMNDAGAWNAENLNYDLLKKFPSDFPRGVNINHRLKTTKDIREFIQSKGYDGVVYKNTGETAGAEEYRRAVQYAKAGFPPEWVGKSNFSQEDQKNPAYIKWREADNAYAQFREDSGEDSYIAFEPTQIKSSIGNNGDFSPTNPDIRYSRESQADTFYSQLEKAVRTMPDKLFQNGANFKLHLISNMSKYGIKKEELHFSGVLDWLQTQGKVSKVDVVNFLNKNGVQVEEVVLGEVNLKDEARRDDLLERYRDLTDEIANSKKAFEEGTKTIDEHKNTSRKASAERSKLDEEINEINARRDDTKFATHVPPGGQPGTYRELLLTLPVGNPTGIAKQLRNLSQWPQNQFVARNPADQEKLDKLLDENPDVNADGVSDFRSGHFDQPNIIAHLRVDEVEGANGERLLRVNELQSDWAQKGRKDGFKSEEAARKNEFAQKRYGKSYAQLLSGEKAAVDHSIVELLPSAPFVTDTSAWLSLAIKKAISFAAQNGMDGIVFATGQQNADLYDLSKQVDSVTVWSNEADGYHFEGKKNGRTVVGEGSDERGGVSANKLADYIGKELAAKAVEDIKLGRTAKYEGQDLKVGGEGMRKFYDEIIPQVTDKVLKQIGADVKVDKVDVGDSEASKFSVVLPNGKVIKETDALSNAEKIAELNEGAVVRRNSLYLQQPGFLLNDSILSKVRNEGLPLFSRKQNKQSGFNIPEETSAQKVQRQHQDSLNRIKIIQNAIVEQGGVMDVQHDVYQAMERMTGRAASQQENFTDNVVDPLMKRVADLKATSEELGTYLMAMGAKDRNAYIQTKREDMPDNGSGMTNEEAEGVLADYRKRGDFELFDKLARDIQKITDTKLNLLAEGNVMTDEQVKTMRLTMGFYVPYRGFEVIDDSGAKVGNGIGGGYSTSKRVSKQAMGRISRAGQVVENIFRDYHAAIFLVEKAVVGEYLHKLVKDNPDASLWSIESPEKTPVMGADGQVQHRDMGFDDTKEVRYIKNGEEFRIQLRDPIMAAAYNNLNASKLGFILEAASNLNMFLRQMYTQKNPEFLVTNFLRDAQTSFAVLTGEGGAGYAIRTMRHVPGMMKAMFAIDRHGKVGNINDEYYALAKQSGALTAFAMLDDLETQQLKLDAAIARHGGSGVVQAWKKGLSHKGTMLSKSGSAVSSVSKILLYRLLDSNLLMLIENMNHAAENSYRMAAFRTYIEDHGGIKNVKLEVLAEASRIAKNVTVNFNKKGEQTRAWNAAYLFWNANVQGTQNLFRAATQTPHKKQVQAILAGLFAMGVIASMATGDDDDELTSEYDKEHNINMHFGETTIKMVLAYGLGFFFGAGYTAGNVMQGRVKPMKGAISLVGQFMGHFTPIGSPIVEGDMTAKNFAVSVTPTMLSPMVMSATNTNSFGSKVVPHFSDDDGKPDRETMYRGTRGTLYDKAANSAVLAWADVSPETLKMMSGFLTGGVGTFASNSLATGTDVLKGEFPDVERAPFVRKVVATKDVEEYRGRFYSQLEDVKKIAGANDVKQSRVLGGTSVVYWQKEMKGLRDKEDVARKAGIRNKIQLAEAAQIALANRFNERYHKAMDRAEKRGMQ